MVKTPAGTGKVIEERGFIRTYYDEEKRLTITGENKLVDIELISAHHIMVPVGDSVRVAELKLNDWSGKNDLFDKLSFFRQKGHISLNKIITYKWAEEITIKISVGFDDKGNELFIDKQIGDWDNAIEFRSLDEIPHKNIRIGIFTKTILKEKVEWIPTIFGFDITEWAAYDVTLIDSLEHDTVDGNYNSLVMIDSTHFILAYASGGEDGYIKTFSIDGSYDNIAQIHSIEHDAELARHNSLVKIDSTHFILAYAGINSAAPDGCIKTFSIDGSYNTTQIDSLTHDSDAGKYNSLVMIDSTHFILAYAGLGADGFIKTFSIDGSHVITEIDSIEHDTILGAYNSLVKIDATHFMLAYSGSGDDGRLKVFTIDGSYNISQTTYLEHDSDYGTYHSLVMIDSTHFILAYCGLDRDGFIKTFSIDGAYNIAEIDSLEHDIGRGEYNSFVMIDSTHFMLAYMDNLFDGHIKVFSIDENYDNITQRENINHDALGGDHNSLIMIDATHFMLAYSGASNDGFIKTFLYEAAAVAAGTRPPRVFLGPFAGPFGGPI